MNSQLKNNISAQKAMELLKSGNSITSSHIKGDVVIEVISDWEEEVSFINCIIESFSGAMTHFQKPVTFLNCQFKKCSFYGSYFVGGLTIKNCSFNDYLEFQSGGHNNSENSIIITKNTFKGFVNFFDCWYIGGLEITDNIFENNTNLFGTIHNLTVTFEVTPVINNNIGKLDVNEEMYDQ